MDYKETINIGLKRSYEVNLAAADIAKLVDQKIIEIQKTMREDEDIHAQQASENGGESLQTPTKKIMSLTAKVMTSTSAYI